MRILSWHFSREDHVFFWVRLFGMGICVKNSPPLFSERYGHTKVHKLPFGFRWIYLEPVDKWLK